MSVKLETAYRQELHNALEKCQFIEETLRMCITHAVEARIFRQTERSGLLLFERFQRMSQSKHRHRRLIHRVRQHETTAVMSQHALEG